MKNHWMENLKLEIKETLPVTESETWVPCDIQISKGANSIRLSCALGSGKLNEKDCIAFAKYIVGEIEKDQNALSVEERYRVFKFVEALSKKSSIDGFLD